VRDVFAEMQREKCNMRSIVLPSHEQVFFYYDPTVPAKIIIAVHNSNAGPAMGGCRMWDYDAYDTMYQDALDLSRAMTRKAILANTGTGGGKMVVWGDPNDPATKSPELFKAIARALNFINAEDLVYITGEDVGMTVPDIEEIAKYVKNDRCVGGRLETFKKGYRRGGGDSSPVTSVGIVHGMKAAMVFIGQGTLRDKTIAIQGLGKVGLSLAQQLREEFPNATLIASEKFVNQRISETAAELDMTLVPPDEIYRQECDIFSPCALGVTLNADNIPELRCKIVGGAQNNQLGTSEDGERLKSRGILYVPDYVINAGGIISLADEALAERGYNRKRVLKKIKGIGKTVLIVLERAEKEDRPTNIVADEMADGMVAALA